MTPGSATKDYFEKFKLIQVNIKPFTLTSPRDGGQGGWWDMGTGDKHKKTDTHTDNRTLRLIDCKMFANKLTELDKTSSVLLLHFFYLMHLTYLKSCHLNVYTQTDRHAHRHPEIATYRL